MAQWNGLAQSPHPECKRIFTALHSTYTALKQLINGLAPWHSVTWKYSKGPGLYLRASFFTLFTVYPCKYLALGLYAPLLYTVITVS